MLNNAYYVQVKGVNDALYYIDRKSKLITKLDVIPDEQVHFERKLSKENCWKKIVEISEKWLDK